MVPPASRGVSAKLRRVLPRAKSKNRVFDVKRFLDSTGLGRRVGKFAKEETVFAQGDPAKHVMYIQEGGMKLSVVNQTGREAVVAILGPGDFFGEGCLGGQARCMATALSRGVRRPHRFNTWPGHAFARFAQRSNSLSAPMNARAT